MPPDSGFDGGIPAHHGAAGDDPVPVSVVATPGEPRFAGSGRRDEAAIEALTASVGRLRRGVAALRAENHELRLELETLRTGEQASAAQEDPAGHDFGELVDIAIPAGPKAPGTARSVLEDHLATLVEPRVLQDAQLLMSELVTNCLVHGQLTEGDTVRIRILLATDALRLEVENPGTAGIVAANPGAVDVSGGFGLQLVQILGSRWGAERNRSTSVWVEMEWS